MARPKKNGMDYFPHDTDARNDLKLRKLRAVFGNDGYATYFILLENIYRQNYYELDISDAETRLILSEECRISKDTFDLIISKCIELKLFDEDSYKNHQVLTSKSIKKRAEPIENKRNKNNKSYSRNDSDDSDSFSGVSDAETPAEMPQSKVKESKVKEIYNIYITTTDLSLSDIQKVYESEYLSLLTPAQGGTILNYMKHINANTIIYAIIESAKQGREKSNFAYLEKILQRYKENGIKTIEQAEKSREEHQVKNQNRQKGEINGEGKSDTKPDIYADIPTL